MKYVVSYRGIPQSRGWATGDCLIRALHFLGYEAIPYGNYHQTSEFMGTALPEKDDVLIFLECNDGDPQYLSLIDLPCCKVFWDFDTEMHLEASLFLSHRFDFVFLANPAYLVEFNRSQYLPYAFDHLWMKSDEKPKKGAAVIGSPFSARMNFARTIDADMVSGIYRQQYLDVIKQLKVNVHNLASGGRELLVMRIFETMGLGTTLLTEFSKTLERHFVDGEDLITYQDAKDCKAKLDLLLGDDYYCDKIAKQGQAKVLAHHTYVNRAKIILGAIA
jgi:spore maturation protein CgeB